MAHEDIIGKNMHWVKTRFEPPTKNPDDCICGAKGDPKAGRILIANCPCCDGVQYLKQEICECPPGSHKLKLTVTIAPNTTQRLRYIDTVGPIE